MIEELTPAARLYAAAYLALRSDYSRVTPAELQHLDELGISSVQDRHVYFASFLQHRLRGGDYARHAEPLLRYAREHGELDHAWLAVAWLSAKLKTELLLQRLTTPDPGR